MMGVGRAAGPLWLWTGIVAGLVAWLVNLTVNDARAGGVCTANERPAERRRAAGLVVTVAGWFVSWSASARRRIGACRNSGQSRFTSSLMACFGVVAGPCSPSRSWWDFQVDSLDVCD